MSNKSLKTWNMIQKILFRQLTQLTITYIFEIQILVIDVKQILMSNSSFEPQRTSRGKAINWLRQEDVMEPNQGRNFFWKKKILKLPNKLFFLFKKMHQSMYPQLHALSHNDHKSFKIIFLCTQIRTINP